MNPKLVFPPLAQHPSRFTSQTLPPHDLVVGERLLALAQPPPQLHLGGCFPPSVPSPTSVSTSTSECRFCH